MIARIPEGTPVYFSWRSSPVLKRWADKHCAPGADSRLT